jgi:ribonuclease BN (tRNA processing enzyme)
MNLSYTAPGKAFAAPAPLSLVVLGSGGPAAFGRASTSYLILIDGVARILVDAGSGAFTRLGESRIDVSHLDTLLLTHLHLDHAAEVPGILKARVITRRAVGEIDLLVFGPEGKGIFPSTSEFIRLLFEEQGAFVYLKTFGGATVRINVRDLPIDLASTPHEIFSRDGVIIRAVATHHGDAPSNAYRIDYRGASLVFSGDIDPSALSNLAHLAQGTDVLVFHCAVLDPPASPALLYRFHTPPQQIGQIVAAAGVKHVVLSHLSPDIEQAKSQVMQSLHTSYVGEVLFATDLMRIDSGEAAADSR